MIRFQIKIIKVTIDNPAQKLLTLSLKHGSPLEFEPVECCI